MSTNRPTPLSAILGAVPPSPVRPDVSHIRCPACGAQASYDVHGRITIVHTDAAHDADAVNTKLTARALSQPVRRVADDNGEDWTR